MYNSAFPIRLLRKAAARRPAWISSSSNKPPPRRSTCENPNSYPRELRGNNLRVEPSEQIHRVIRPALLLFQVTPRPKSPCPYFFPILRSIGLTRPFYSDRISPGNLRFRVLSTVSRPPIITEGASIRASPSYRFIRRGKTKRIHGEKERWPRRTIKEAALSEGKGGPLSLTTRATPFLFGCNCEEKESKKDEEEPTRGRPRSSAILPRRILR